MSKYLVYLDMKPFLAQWLHYHYGNPVVFPAQSAENACIRRLLIPQPTATPVLRRGNEVAICIPDSKQKPVVTYNYLSHHGCKLLAEFIENTFRLQLWSDLSAKEFSQCTLLTAVRAWCEANGISTDYDYTLKMRYQRMRRAYLPAGIDLRRKSRTQEKKR